MEDRARSNVGLLRNPVHLLALGFGTGLAPRAPGTVGTLIALPIAAALRWAAPWLCAVIIAVLIAAGIGICGVSARKLPGHDHPGIVFDEIVGYLIAFVLTSALMPFRWYSLAGLFVIFRVFDVVKPWPMSWVDKKVTGGTGIMMDDVLAGIYSGVVWLGVWTWILPGH